MRQAKIEFELQQAYLGHSPRGDTTFSYGRIRPEELVEVAKRVFAFENRNP